MPRNPFDDTEHTEVETVTKLHEVVADAIKPYNKPDRDDCATAVLAALTANGYVVGRVSDEDFAIYPDEDGVFNWPDGLALVRVEVSDEAG